MEIVRVIYQGFSAKDKQYANCILMIRREHFSVSKIYEISVLKKYPICSDIHLDVLIEQECVKEGGEFWAAYLEAVQKTYSLTTFPVRGTGRMPLMVPRFSEADFTELFEELGGHKIPESNVETPDFRLNGIIMELKDLQKDSLRDTDRQENIANVFSAITDRCVNVDPSIDLGEVTLAYHRLIQNAVHNHLKKASSQIKSYKQTEAVKAGGMLFLNTGMFSLPHELFKTMVTDLLERRTKTIEFVFLFSQVAQGNGFDQYAIFKGEFVGNVPEEVLILQERVNELIEEKMTIMMMAPGQGLTLEEQRPISFEKDGKIFYWNPGPVPDSRFE